MTLYLSQKDLLFLLLYAFAIGFLLALLYDFLRLFRRARKPRRAVGRFLHHTLVALEDLLFFLFCGVVFSILFFVMNSGKVRPSAFFMAFLGFLLCRLTLSRLTFMLLIKLTDGIKALLRLLFTRVLLPPLLGLFTLMRRLVCAVSLSHRRKQTQQLLTRLADLGKQGYLVGLGRLRHRSIQKDGSL